MIRFCKRSIIETRMEREEIRGDPSIPLTPTSIIYDSTTICDGILWWERRLKRLGKAYRMVRIKNIPRGWTQYFASSGERVVLCCEEFHRPDIIDIEMDGDETRLDGLSEDFTRAYNNMKERDPNFKRYLEMEESCMTSFPFMGHRK